MLALRTARFTSAVRTLWTVRSCDRYANASSIRTDAVSVCAREDRLRLACLPRSHVARSCAFDDDISQVASCTHLPAASSLCPTIGDRTLRCAALLHLQTRVLMPWQEHGTHCQLHCASSAASCPQSAGSHVHLQMHASRRVSTALIFMSTSRLVCAHFACVSCCALTSRFPCCKMRDTGFST